MKNINKKVINYNDKTKFMVIECEEIVSGKMTHYLIYNSSIINQDFNEIANIKGQDIKMDIILPTNLSDNYLVIKVKAEKNWNQQPYTQYQAIDFNGTVLKKQTILPEESSIEKIAQVEEYFKTSICETEV